MFWYIIGFFAGLFLNWFMDTVFGSEPTHQADHYRRDDEHDEYFVDEE